MPQNKEKHKLKNKQNDPLIEIPMGPKLSCLGIVCSETLIYDLQW